LLQVTTPAAVGTYAFVNAIVAVALDVAIVCWPSGSVAYRAPR